MNEGINTKNLEEEYRNALCSIEDYVEQLKKEKRLPKKFKFQPKELGKLEELIVAMEDSHTYEVYTEDVLELIDVVREIDELKNYLIGYGLRDANWVSGIILPYYYSLRATLYSQCESELVKRIPADILPYVELNVGKLIDARESDYYATVSFRGYELTFEIQ